MWWPLGVVKQIQIRWTAKARICQNISTLRLNASEVSISSLWVCWNVFKPSLAIVKSCQINHLPSLTMISQWTIATDNHAATSHQPGEGGRVTTSPSGTLWTPSAEANFCRSSVGSACRDRMIATGWSCWVRRVTPRCKPRGWIKQSPLVMWFMINSSIIQTCDMQVLSIECGWWTANAWSGMCFAIKQLPFLHVDPVLASPEVAWWTSTSPGIRWHPEMQREHEPIMVQ